MTDFVQIGNATLYLGDCLEILPTLKKIDAVVTDPPYGINADLSMYQHSGKVVGRGPGPGRRNRRIAKREYEHSEWDKTTADEAINIAIQISDAAIVFGGNYYNLPPSKCWLVWDKQNYGTKFADCELAWTNLNQAVRLKRHQWNGMARQNAERRYNHPTKKPLGVMEWCLSFLPDAQIILDPFMGSGTTGVACVNLGRKFIGIEIEPKYFDIACERIEATYAQGRLFA